MKSIILPYELRAKCNELVMIHLKANKILIRQKDFVLYI